MGIGGWQNCLYSFEWTKSVCLIVCLCSAGLYFTQIISRRWRKPIGNCTIRTLKSKKLHRHELNFLFSLKQLAASFSTRTISFPPFSPLNIQKSRNIRNVHLLKTIIIVSRVEMHSTLLSCHRQKFTKECRLSIRQDMNNNYNWLRICKSQKMCT